MAFFDGTLECQKKIMKRVRVPGLRGGSDRTIYVNGSSSGYRLGNHNDEIYTLHGKHVSSLPLMEFAKNFLWESTKKALWKQGSFFCIKSINLYNAFYIYLRKIEWCKKRR